MRVNILKSKNKSFVYIIKSTWDGHKHSSKIVKKLGDLETLKKEHSDPIAWAKTIAKEMTDEENKKKKELTNDVTITLSANYFLKKDEQKIFNCGYLFLQKLYYKLKIDKICKKIKSKYKIKFDLNSILSMLLYSRIIYPSSKLSSYETAEKFLEKKNYNLQNVYRALDTIADETDFIQSELYKNSKLISKRNDSVLYYDCTNYFFETEYEEGIKKYGASKEHRPNPIIQMGLFMDADGIPLAFNINAGNTNEQLTLKPLEQQIINDFDKSKFIVCTDAGLSSLANKKFNSHAGRSYITTQSIKKLAHHLKEYALDEKNWTLAGTNKIFNLDEIEKDKDLYTKYFNSTFYKSRWTNEKEHSEKLIVTFSFKYKNYQENIRNEQINRAKSFINDKTSMIEKKSQNDCKRFIKKTSVTPDGEVAKNNLYALDEEKIKEEAKYDGFYAVTTNLKENEENIIIVNHRRWEIEECFRIMKTEFKARPVYLKRDNRIKAHFTTCFLSLVIYRYLEKQIKNKLTCREIIDTLKNMNLQKISGEGYIPAYNRTNATDILHESFDFHTDYQILTNKYLNHILRETKK